MTEWISVKERLPKKFAPVLLFAPQVPDGYLRYDSPIFCGYLEGEIYPDRDRRGWACVWGDNWVPYDFEDVTHWMPLPEPPEDK